MSSSRRGCPGAVISAGPPGPGICAGPPGPPGAGMCATGTGPGGGGVGVAVVVGATPSRVTAHVHLATNTAIPISSSLGVPPEGTFVLVFAAGAAKGTIAIM